MNAQAHPTTIIVVDPESGQRSMIVEVHPEIVGEVPDQGIRVFEQRMFDRNVRVGLVFTPAWTYVVRDLLNSMSFDDNKFDVSKVETPLLLRAATLGPPRPGSAFSHQVVRWLEAIAGAWSSFLPSEAFPAMVPEVIGNLAQAHFEQWDDVLKAGDAA